MHNALAQCCVPSIRLHAAAHACILQCRLLCEDWAFHELQRHEKEVAAESAWKLQHSKEERKRRYIQEGQAAQRTAKKQRRPQE